MNLIHDIPRMLVGKSSDNIVLAYMVSDAFLIPVLKKPLVNRFKLKKAITHAWCCFSEIKNEKPTTELIEYIKFCGENGYSYSKDDFDLAVRIATSGN